LPSYARPLFLRIRQEIEVTGTFKYSKTDLVRQGYDPDRCTDPVYFDHPGERAYVALEPELFQRIQGGEIRI
jgi:fatty-acyl-CoA synthase